MITPQRIKDRISGVAYECDSDCSPTVTSMIVVVFIIATFPVWAIPWAMFVLAHAIIGWEEKP